jgi:hypothetical protein
MFSSRLAILGAAVAFLSLVSMHVLSPEYSPAWRMVSEYANGQYAWVLSLMFAAFGLSELALAVGLQPLLATRSGRVGVGILAVAAIAGGSAAVFDLNQVVVHELAGIIGIFGLPIAAVLISRELGGQPRRLLAQLTWMSVVLWIATFGLMIATFIGATGGLPSEPPAQVPAGVIALVGWTDRLMLVSSWAWVTAVASYVLEQSGHGHGVVHAEFQLS